jgi:phosphohistidine phosphatase
MLVYLVRHGEAKSEMEDTSRPLSEKGQRDIGVLADLVAARFKLFPGRVYHSPRLRATQTAAIICEKLPHAPAIVETDGLSPMDDPGLWAERLASEEMDVMLVGHLPHISKLASNLLICEGGREIADFKPGTVVCLEKTGAWRLKWMVSPDILKPL